MPGLLPPSLPSDRARGALLPEASDRPRVASTQQTSQGGTVKTTAAILWEENTPWSVEEIDLDPPKAGEVLVELAASGLCHSDEHVVTGDLRGFVGPLPTIGGHEGAGVVLEVGDGVRSVAPGDHVVFSFVPACGRCPSCATGHSNLCDLAGLAASGLQVSDLTSRHHARGRDLTLAIGGLGTFAHHTVVNEASCVKIDRTHPLDRACLLGCGVVTGWGSAVNAGRVAPDDYVAIVGIGGIGASAILGAKAAGARVIAAVDPVELKRTKAIELGATHAYSSIAEARADLAESTWNRGFDVVIMAMSVGSGAALGEASELAGKRGRIVVTNMHPATEASVDLSAIMLTVFERQIVGSLFGSANARYEIPMLLELYSQGRLDLDALVTRTYPLEGINEGYEDMRAGRNLRGVLVYGNGA